MPTSISASEDIRQILKCPLRTSHSVHQRFESDATYCQLVNAATLHRRNIGVYRCGAYRKSMCIAHASDCELTGFDVGNDLSVD